MSQQGSEQAGLVEDGEKRFQLLLETLPHIAFAIRPGGHAEYYNQRFIDYLGFRPGPDRAARTALNHPDDRALLEVAREAGAAASNEYIVEVRLRRHDGVYRWHRIHNKPLIRDGRAVGWLGTAVDIHDIREANEVLEARVRQRTSELEAANQRLIAEVEQRRRTEDGLRDSEARYRKLYNRTPMALQSVDAEARLLDVNDTWVAMFGYARDAVIGRSPVDFMTAESAARYRVQAWPEMLASGEQTRSVDYQFVTSSGDIFDGRLAARGEFDADGRFVRSWSAIADVTAEKRADRDLRQAQRMEAVGQLTAGIAHDFNNLLTAVLGNLELLARQIGQQGGAAPRLLAGAQKAAERGARLTGQLLAFSRQQRIVAEATDLDRVIQGMLPMLHSTIGAAIGIDVGVAADLWTALADTTQVELALLNLAINARDAMPQGGAIRMTAANVSRGEPERPEQPVPGDYVAVSVSDTGSGMTASVQERIFEPFFTTKGVGKGSGLGLPQVLGVVKQLGGGMSVCSAPNQGTCVTIFLPRAEAAAEPAAAEVAGGKAGCDTTPDRSRRILMVDDDADVRVIAAEMLRDAGYEVVEAASGAAALELLRCADSRIDLLVVDVAMPGINGVEMATIARHALPALPVVFMTGYAGESLLPSDGDHDVLRKPFVAVELEAKVGRAIGRTRARLG